MTRIHFLLTQLLCSALALLLPASAVWANWGENWGSMVWSAAPPVVPGLGALGLATLALGLAAAAAWQLRRRAFAMSVLLVVLAIPLAAVAGSISGLNVFVNGQPADATDVNENFEIVETAVNDNDGRITAAQSAADAAAAGHTTDTTLDETAVDAFVANNGYATGAHTVDTNTQLTDAEVKAAAMAEGFVTGAHTTNTTLDETAVDAFVANNGYAAASIQGPHDRSGDHNTALGNLALLNNTDGSANTAVGDLALLLNTTGDSNTASGYQALASNTEGNYNTASGNQALWLNITGSWNTAVGWRALRSNTEGDHNTATGVAALWLNTTGHSNTATGSNALNSNTIGNSNTASGREALTENTEGFDNTANGTQALFSNTTGDRNTASGKHALRSNAEGGYNTASGFQALYSNTADYNTASGANALYFNTEGDSNTASGVSALIYNTTGRENTAVGGDALYSNTTGDGNIALGHGSGYNLTTGDNNIMIGNEGAADEAGTIRLGTSGTHSVTHLVGDVQINGVSIDSSDIATNAAAIVNAQTTADGAAAAAGTAQSTADAATSAVADEAAARLSADTALQSGIDSEASTRAGADITLQGHLDAEAISRSSGDSALDTRVGELETGRLKKDAEIPTAGETSSAAVDADSVYTVTNTSPNIIPTDLLSYPILADIPISAEGFRAQSVPSSAVTDGIRTGVHGVVSINDEEDLSQTSVINAGVRGTASGNAAGQQGWVYNVGLFGAARGTQTEQGTVTNIGTYAFADGTSETAVGLMAEAAGGAVRSTGIGAYVAGAGGSSENVGGRFDVQSNGGPLPATHYGIRASASGAEQNYGGWFDVHSNGGPIPATHYGIFASASGAETNWAGYFQGDVKVTDDLEVDGELDVSEDISAANYPKMVAAEASNEISLGTSYSDVVSVSITTASAGSILVTFSGYLQTDTAGGYVQAGVGTNDGAVTRYVRAQSTETSEYHPFSVQYLYTNPEGGTFTYYGNAMSSIAGGDVYQPYMTAVYTD